MTITKTEFFGAMALIALPVSALAAKLPLDGAYGTKEGCIYAKSGDSSGADDFLLLTEDDVRTSASYCAYKSIGTTTGNATTVTLSCSAEGEEGETDMQADVVKTSKTSYAVKFTDGAEWGPFKKCK